MTLPSPRARLARLSYSRLVVTILGLAVLLRVAGMTFHSLWLDEAVAVNWARLPLAELWARTITLQQDSHPPLYYMTLDLWRRLFGEGEWSVRGLSVVLGVALVAVIYALGKELGGGRVGLIAGALAAISPYLVWYSQEVRMYAMLGLLSTTGFYCLWRGLEDGRARWWLGYLLATIAAMYSQIIGSLLLPLELLVVLLSVRRQPRRALQGLAVVVLAGLAFVPLALTAWHSSGTTSTERVAPVLLSVIPATAQILLLRQVPAGWGILAVPGAILAVIGVAAALQRDTRRGLAIALYSVVVLGLIFVLSVWRLPIFGQPYLIVLAAPVLIAVALGIDALWRRNLAAGSAAFLAVTLVSLFALRFDWDRSMGKEDWRAAAQYLAAYAGPNDAILVVPNYAAIPLTYYYKGHVPVLEPFGATVQPDAIAPALSGLEQYRTVWLVWSHGEQIDPQGNVRRWLMERYPVLTEQYPRGVELRALAVQYRLLGAENMPALATFGGQMSLVAAQADASVVAHDEEYHPPSGWVHVDLQWQRLGSRDPSWLTVRVRVTDSLGQVWGERLQRATEVWSFYPPQRWQASEVVRDAYDVNMNPKTPPDRYRVEVQVLDSNRQPLPVTAQGMPADRYFVSDVEVR